MKKIRQYLFIILLVIIAILAGFNYFVRPFEKKFVEVQEVMEVSEKFEDKTIITKIDILNNLSPRERVAQMMAFPVTIDSEQSDFIDDFDKQEGQKKTAPGFVTIFGSDIASKSAKIKILKVEKEYESKFLPVKFAVDHEGGSVQRLNGKGYTQLPSWNEVCQLENEERMNLLRKSARELDETGIDVVFAPVLDVGSSRFLRDRICSDSYSIVADRSMGFASVFSEFNILSVLKHFPGIGAVQKDLHYNFDSVSVDVSDVKLYQLIIDQSSKVAVMVTHIGVENQDAEVPCSLSSDCVGELKTAYPNILVFSDSLDMESAAHNKEDLKNPKELAQVTLEAIRAGNDVLVYGQGTTVIEIDNILIQLTSEYEKNAEFGSLVDKAVLKIIEYKYAQ